MALPLVALAMAGCSDVYSYDADTAVSPYEPVKERRLVSQVKTTNSIDGRNYSWEHSFSYDVHGRIKEISSRIVHHRAVRFENVTRYYLCNVTSKACYYYLGNDFRIEYSNSYEFPDFPEWDFSDNSKERGVFNENGTLAQYSQMDFSYAGKQLQRAYAETGRIYEQKRDSEGNVTGYVVRNMSSDGTDVLISDYSNEYIYSQKKNRTNFDFSGYFGYWGLEEGLLASPYYSQCQLAAFGMLGTTGSCLPVAMLSRDSKGDVVKNEYGPVYLSGTWELDSLDCPVSFVDGMGRRTEIRYVE